MSEAIGHLLDFLEAIFKATSLPVRREGRAIILAQHDYETRMALADPPVADTGDSEITGVLTVRSSLPPILADLFEQFPGAREQGNTLASLGGLVSDDQGDAIVSRLTLYKGEEARDLNLRFVMMAALTAVEAIRGGLAAMGSRQSPSGGGSAWTAEEFAEVEALCGEFAFMNAADDGLTAEFGLGAGETSAMFGHGNTALFQLSSGEPHPELGGGLFCLLQMPQSIDDPVRRARVIAELNRQECEPHDLPPHFGAWCEGRMKNPAYVSFLPNALHAIPGVAANVTMWAMHRATLADAMIRTMGVRGKG